MLEPNPLHAARTFWDKTIVRQLNRESPFSLWDWRQYHAGLPDLHIVQQVLIALVLLAAIGAAFYPRRRSPLQLAALTGALIAAFELVLTYWFYTYIVWFFPFAAIALLAGSGAIVRARRDVEDAARVDARRSRKALGPDRRVDRRCSLPRLLGDDSPRLLHQAPDRRHAALPALRRLDHGRQRPLSELLARIPARSPAGVRPSRHR